MVCSHQAYTIRNSTPGGLHYATQTNYSQNTIVPFCSIGTTTYADRARYNDRARTQRPTQPTYPAAPPQTVIAPKNRQHLWPSFGKYCLFDQHEHLQKQGISSFVRKALQVQLDIQNSLYQWRYHLDITTALHFGLPWLRFRHPHH